MELPKAPEVETSTHAVIAEKLRLRREAAKGVDVSKLTPVVHEVLGETFFPGPMAYESYNTLTQIKRFEDIQHSEANRTNADPKDTLKSDAFLLANAVFTSDGKALGSELAKQLMEIPGAGVDNFRLIGEADKCNPPRHHIANEVMALMSTNSVQPVLWRMLLEGGLVKVLIDSMSTYASPEEREWANKELNKAEELIYALYPMYEADEAARVMEITFKDAFKLISIHGSAEAAIDSALASGEPPK